MVDQTRSSVTHGSAAVVAGTDLKVDEIVVAVVAIAAARNQGVGPLYLSSGVDLSKRNGGRQAVVLFRQQNTAKKKGLNFT